MNVTFKIIALILSLYFGSLIACSEESKITAYFFNDSVNGFQFSDAYETHNMGLRYEKSAQYYQIDLGIVTPDMFEFENIYRTANRSFGELITLSYGKKGMPFYENFEFDFFSKITSQGEFGISGLQSIIHQFANFQDDIELLETVRMPSETWIGGGIDLKLLKTDVNQKHQFGVLSYLGTDRLSLQPYISFVRDLETWSQFGKLGLEFVAFDNIISAPPIEAPIRDVRPTLSFGFKRDVGPLIITVSENLSLPSISTDDRLYARLFMSASIPIENIQELITSQN